MNRSSARITSILAIVFPLIVAAALALAYYGYRYAKTSSERANASLMDGNRQLAQSLVSSIQQRIDTIDFELFKQLEWDEAQDGPPELATVPPAIESVVVLDASLRIRSLYPASDTRHRSRQIDRWQTYVRGLDWESLQPWTPAQPGNFRHLHQLFDGKSVLIAYARKRSESGQPYYVAAKMNLPVIVKEWLPEEIRALGGGRRIAVLDEMGRPLYGKRGSADDRFRYDAAFGKTLYAWRIQLVPKNVHELQAQVESERLLGVLLIPVSTLIIAVGLAIVWLSVMTERRASRLKSDFIANVSHELKTPLSLIRMFGELLVTGRHKGPSGAREYAAIITREAERLSHLIDNVLDFARLERGKASYQFAEGRLDDLVDRALDLSRYRVEKEKMQLVTDIEPDLPLVRMDENALTLVVLNLIDNAVKYARDGHEIAVHLGRTPGGVALSVRDNGPGIPAEEQPRIFERFYRAQGARAQNVRGSGIGLALVQHIVRAHGGHVTVESAPGAGATFRVVLPASATMAPVGASAGSTSVAPTSAAFSMATPSPVDLTTPGAETPGISPARPLSRVADPADGIETPALRPVKP